MTIKLIVAVREDGGEGAPRGLFYPNTPEGHLLADQFAERENRPGWGIFETPNPLREDIDHQRVFNDYVAELQRQD